MKITIELSDEEVLGIKDYLRMIDAEQDGKKYTKEDVRIEIMGIVSAGLQCGAIADHIAKFYGDYNH